MPINTLVTDPETQRAFVDWLPVAIANKDLNLWMTKAWPPADEATRALPAPLRSFHLWNFMMFHLSRLELRNRADSPGTGPTLSEWGSRPFQWTIKGKFEILAKVPMNQWLAHVKTAGPGVNFCASTDEAQYCSTAAVAQFAAWTLGPLEQHDALCRAQWQVYKGLLEAGTDPLVLTSISHPLPIYVDAGDATPRAVFEMRDLRFSSVAAKVLVYRDGGYTLSERTPSPVIAAPPPTIAPAPSGVSRPPPPPPPPGSGKLPPPGSATAPPPGGSVTVARPPPRSGRKLMEAGEVGVLGDHVPR